MNFFEISEKTFLKYFQNKLPAEQKKKLSQSVLSDRFLSDAIEGFENNPEALNDINGLKNRFYFNKGIRAKVSVKYIFLSVGLFVAAISFFVLYNRFQTSQLEKTASFINEKTEIQALQKNEIIQENEIASSSPIAQENQITSTSVLKNQPKTIVQEKTEMSAIVPVQSKKVQMLTEKPSNVTIEKELDKKLITYSNFPVIYIVNLKTIDYSKVYKNRPVLPEGNGLESKFESGETKTVFTFDNAAHYIPYKVFLETALQKYTDADYKGALRDFTTILKTFPDDLNAYFYGGLCLYNLQKSEKAIACFDNAIENSINSFYQEARWYKALTLIQNNKKEKALNLLSQIIDESGFYSEKAKALSKTIK